MTAGAEAGSIWRDGYRYIRFNGAVYLAHRLAFALHHGFFPEAIDHINTVKNDNRISNLRQATVAENNRNKQKQANNSTGYKGVSFNKKTKKFQARITSDGTHHSLGNFATLEEAASAYAKAAGDLHGEFARFEHPAPIPEGWQLVPIEPTTEMIIAGNDGFHSPDMRRHTVSGCYKAMLNAAKDTK